MLICIFFGYGIAAAQNPKMEQVMNSKQKHIAEVAGRCRRKLFGEKEYTQREIAKRLNISRSYVSRIEKNALLKLRRLFLSS